MITTPTPPKPAAKTAVRNVLDADKRQDILALLANGNSLRTAAGYVGCAASTITRTAARDADFAGQLSRARQQLEVDCWQRLHEAASQPRYWRAAAWILERCHPEIFEKKDSTSILGDEGELLLAQMLSVLLEGLPEPYSQQIIERWEAVRMAAQLPDPASNLAALSSLATSAEAKRPPLKSPPLSPSPAAAAPVANAGPVNGESRRQKRRHQRGSCNSGPRPARPLTLEDFGLTPETLGFCITGAPSRNARATDRRRCTNPATSEGKPRTPPAAAPTAATPAATAASSAPQAQT